MTKDGYRIVMLPLARSTFSYNLLFVYLKEIGTGSDFIQTKIFGEI